MRSLRPVALACLVAAAAAPARGETPAPDDPPRLVLLLAIDQLRPDRLAPELPGGLGRLAREGRVYGEAALEHALTETCPGHATMLTGRYPAATGIPANATVEPDASAPRYCVADDPESTGVIGNPTVGRSPKKLRVDTLGDWMKRANPASQVYAVSGKDRAAITLGGHQPDGVYWYDRHVTPRFTTSRHYAEQLPEWLAAWNGVDAPNDGFLAALPETWDHGPIAAPHRIDDFVGEDERNLRVTGHPLTSGELAEIGEQLYGSPHLDVLTLDVARQLVEREGLGTDDSPDLLAVSLSGHDVVGHLYGPFSHESQDTLRRLDEELDELLAELDRITRGRLLVALTSDHGVLPLPEFRAPEGTSCPESGSRIGMRRMMFKVLIGLHFELSPLSWPRWWLVIGGSQMGVDRALAERRGVDPSEVIAAAERRLEDVPAIREAWTREEIETRDGEHAQLFRNSFVPGRSGDLVVEGEPGCLIWPFDAGTTHGSPHAYDRRVPLVFFGNGIEPAWVAGPASPTDIAPTLAARLGIEVPDDLDGRALFDARAASPAAEHREDDDR